MDYPKPVNFLPADKVLSARFSPIPPPFLRRPPRTGRKRQGILYEERVHQWLDDEFAGSFVPGPWIVFDDSKRRVRWCQPDGLLFDVRRGRVTVIEAKHSHCAQAWFQLFQLYIPVVCLLFPPPSWSVVGIEIVRWFDPHTATPVAAIKRANVLDALEGQFCVHIFKPRS